MILYNSKKHKGKLKLIDNGPYQIDHVYLTRVIMLRDLEGIISSDLINESQLKKYYCPILEPLESYHAPR